MASQIDPTVIRDNQKVEKSDLRKQFEIAADEITKLQLDVALPSRMAFSNTDFNSL